MNAFEIKTVTEKSETIENAITHYFIQQKNDFKTKAEAISNNIDTSKTLRLQWIVADIGGYTMTVNDGVGKPQFFHVENDEDLVKRFQLRALLITNTLIPLKMD